MDPMKYDPRYTEVDDAGMREHHEALSRQMELLDLEHELKRQMGALPAQLTNEQVKQALLRTDPHMIIKHLRYFAMRGPEREEYATGVGAIPQPDSMFESAQPDHPATMWGWDPAPDSCIPRMLIPAALQPTFDENHYRYHTSEGDWYTLVPPNKEFDIEGGDEPPSDTYLLNDDTLNEEMKALRAFALGVDAHFDDAAAEPAPEARADEPRPEDPPAKADEDDLA